MHGAVMSQRWVFNEFRFDDRFSVYPEYDLYLKISRNYRVHHHHKYTVLHRVDKQTNLSDIPAILRSVQLILKRQRKQVKNRIERQCLKNGLIIWENYYCEQLFQRLEKLNGISIMANRRELWVLFKYSPLPAMRIVINKCFYRGRLLE